MLKECNFYFIGSYPLPPKGLQLKILLRASRLPFKAPCFCIASIAYCEQVGVYLQEEGKIGDIAI